MSSPEFRTTVGKGLLAARMILQQVGYWISPCVAALALIGYVVVQRESPVASGFTGIVVSCYVVAFIFRAMNRIAPPPLFWPTEQDVRNHYYGRDPIFDAMPLSEWTPEVGQALWWSLPVRAKPYVGTPRDADWPGDCTHWTMLVTPLAPEIDSN